VIRHVYGKVFVKTLSTPSQLDREDQLKPTQISSLRTIIVRAQATEFVRIKRLGEQ